MTMRPGNRACYPRMNVVSRNWRTAKDCKAYLARIEKWNERRKYTPTVYCDGLQFDWSRRGTTQAALVGIDVPEKVPQVVEVILVRENSPAFRAAIGVALARHESLFEEAGEAEVSLERINTHPRTLLPSDDETTWKVGGLLEKANTILGDNRRGTGGWGVCSPSPWPSPGARDDHAHEARSGPRGMGGGSSR